MHANIYKCLRMNWLSGMYEWMTFMAADEAEARRRASASRGYLAESLAPAHTMH